MRLIALAVLAQVAIAAGPKLGPTVQLFNGKDLRGFYTYVQDAGANNDKDGVFRVANGQIHISGTKYAYLITDKEYDNYYLAIDFRWGQATHPPRVGKARDSGILFHVVGEDKIWPRSLEFQMIEGGTGDLILVGGTSVTVGGQIKDGRSDRFGKGPFEDIAGYRDPNGEVEKPLGQWNRLELWADGDRVKFSVNGKVVNEGTGASVTRGKILLQSEGAELFIRKMELRRILRNPS